MFNISTMRKSAAEVPVENAAETAVDPKPSGFVDIKAAYEQIGNYMRNPRGYSFDVKAESKNNVHTFTITVKPTDMMQKAEQNGAVAPPQAEEPGPMGGRQMESGSMSGRRSEPGPMSSKSKVFMRTADAKASNLSCYPKAFLKSIGF